MTQTASGPRHLAGGVVVVTGGGQGIGRAIALASASEGAHVGVLDIALERAQAVAGEIMATGGAATPVQADVCSPVEVKRAFEDVAAQAGAITGLVNSAGIRDSLSLGDLDLDTWRRVLDVNLTGPFLCIQTAVPYMEQAGRGSIVSITSIAGTLGSRNRIAYGAAKHGLIGLTRSLVLELGDSGIRVNALALGTIQTPFTAAYFEDPDVVAALEQGIPLHRAGTPADVAGFATLLLSEHASFCTGSIIYLDGGWTAAKTFRK